MLRDRWGVPHLYAETAADLWFAQGFVQAQDRLWQMEQMRRVAAGRLSEGVGEEGVRIDRLARVIGFRRAAEAQVEHLTAASRLMLERYAAGVNTFLDLYRNRLPMEFALLGLKPEPWTLADTLSISLLLGWALSHNWLEELARVSYYTRLGPDRAAELLPDYPVENPSVLPGEIAGELHRQLRQAYADLDAYLGLTTSNQGSNNWVVSGAHTLTDKPILANDPHVTVSIPGLWHLIHLETNDETVRLVGASLPGAPGILIGHNQHIAWGVTAALPDVMDLYVEERHPQDPARFRFGEGWEEAQVREEDIIVRGQAQPFRQRVTITRHGPLINDLLQEHERNFPPLALRWTGHEPFSSADAFAALVRARDWEDFRQAVSHLVTPALSFVYADQANNIGFIAAGRVPIRSQGKGLVPSPGHTADHEWVGFIPLDDLPQSYNPASGQLFSANNRIVRG